MTLLKKAIILLCLLAFHVSADDDTSDTYTVCDIAIQRQFDAKDLHFYGPRLSQTQIQCLEALGLKVEHNIAEATGDASAVSTSDSGSDSDKRLLQAPYNEQATVDNNSDRILTSSQVLQLQANTARSFTVNQTATVEFYYVLPSNPGDLTIAIKTTSTLQYSVCYYAEVGDYNSTGTCQTVPSSNQTYNLSFSGISLQKWAGQTLRVSISNPNYDTTGYIYSPYTCNYYYYCTGGYYNPYTIYSSITGSIIANQATPASLTSSIVELLQVNQSSKYAVNGTKTKVFYYNIPSIQNYMLQANILLDNPGDITVSFQLDQQSQYTQICYWAETGDYTTSTNCNNPYYQNAYTLNLHAANLQSWAGLKLMISISNSNSDYTSGNYIYNYNTYSYQYVSTMVYVTVTGTITVTQYPSVTTVTTTQTTYTNVIWLGGNNVSYQLTNSIERRFTINSTIQQEFYYKLSDNPSNLTIILGIDQSMQYTFCYYPETGDYSRPTNCQMPQQGPVYSSQIIVNSSDLQAWAGQNLRILITNPNQDSSMYTWTQYGYGYQTVYNTITGYVGVSEDSSSTPTSQNNNQSTQLASQTVTQGFNTKTIIIIAVLSFVALLAVICILCLVIRIRRKLRREKYIVGPQTAKSSELQSPTALELLPQPPVLLVQPQSNIQSEPANFSKDELNIYFPTERFANHSSFFPQVACQVCSVDFKTEAPCRQLYCGHIFHRGCIDSWLRKHSHCPICSSTMTKSAIQTLLLSRSANLAPVIQNPAPQSYPMHQYHKVNMNTAIYQPRAYYP